MILLVTAYTGWHRRDYSIGDVQCYSKYLRRPRVRTAFLLASLPILPVSTADGRVVLHLLAARTIGSSRGSPTE